MQPNFRQLSPTAKNMYQVFFAFLMVLSIIVGYVSLLFSNSGFGIVYEEYAWAGYVLGFAVIATQLILRYLMRIKKHDPFWGTMGYASYAYGIVTNIIGMAAWQNIQSAATVIDFLYDYGTWLFLDVMLAFFIEVFPEGALMFAIENTDTQFWKGLWAKYKPFGKKQTQMALAARVEKPSQPQGHPSERPVRKGSGREQLQQTYQRPDHTYVAQTTSKTLPQQQNKQGNQGTPVKVVYQSPLPTPPQTGFQPPVGWKSPDSK